MSYTNYTTITAFTRLSTTPPSTHLSTSLQKYPLLYIPLPLHLNGSRLLLNTTPPLHQQTLTITHSYINTHSPSHTHYHTRTHQLPLF
ncbi:hypothetical protein BGX38DRAFT_51384 [Terfezia claveryi]|nr:hypothetical protein BGX38DRAFT_51384 [Terfezia claveryi]